MNQEYFYPIARTIKEKRPRSGFLRAADMFDVYHVWKLIGDVSRERGGVLEREYTEIESIIDSFILYEEGGEILGCVSLEQYSDRIWELRSLAPRFERGKIGGLLMKEAVRQAREKDIPELLTVTDKVGFMKQYGFDAHQTRVAVWLDTKRYQEETSDMHRQELAYRYVSQASIDDIPQIQKKISKDVARGDLLPWTDEELEQYIHDFVVVKDRGIIRACGACIPYTSRIAEVRAVSWDDERDTPYVQMVCTYLNDRIIKSGITQSFALIPERQVNMYSQNYYGIDRKGGKYALWLRSDQCSM